MLLFLFGLVAWATILLARYLDVGPYIFDARRFTRLFTVYYVGAGIALSLSSHTFARPLSIVTLAAVSVFFCYATAAQYARAVHVEHYFATATQAIKRQPIDHEKLVESIPRCKPRSCEVTIEFLRQESISVFGPP